MSDFKVGDKVILKRRADLGEWPSCPSSIASEIRNKEVVITEINKNYPQGHIIIVSLGRKDWWYRENWFESVLTKEEQLIEKINQLYERQAWVKEGKPEAICYTKPVAQSVESRATIDQETILGSIQMDTPIAFAVDLEMVAEEDWIDLRTFHQVSPLFQATTGQLQFQNESSTGLSPMIFPSLRS